MAEYAWRPLNSEVAHGPFASAEDAFRDAVGSFYMPHDLIIEVCLVNYFKSTDWIVGAMDSILDDMNQRVLDACGIEEAVFDVNRDSRKEARTDLDELLRSWAIKHVVTSNAWICGERQCLITLGYLQKKYEEK